MRVTIEIPDSLVGCLSSEGHDLARLVLEGFAAEAYRQGRLSAYQVRLLLGYESRWQAVEFLSSRDLWPGITVEELKRELAEMNETLGRENPGGGS